MTLMDVLPLARSLETDDRRALAQEMLQSLEDDATDPEILRLLHERVEENRRHPDQCVSWEEYEPTFNKIFGIS
ncbi:MAG: addiction module protein [Propionibacteriaceae bacterium]|jgi:hypothetical protein|nr:addiction module protein [Propionibacteriaceae bacterium]